MERKGVVTMKGQPMTLVGPELRPGMKAPDFSCVDSNMAPVTLSDTKGMVRLIASVTSLDTPVCHMETIRFNQEAEKLPADRVSVMVVSMDLPFAQRRFCSMEGVKNVRCASDYRDASFGAAYGVLIKESRLLSRAVFIIDAGGVVRHVEYVKEVADHPDYAAAVKSVNNLIAGAARAAA